MRSWWWIGFGALVLTVSLVRTISVRQNDLRRECAEFQCPEIAFETGVKNLIVEDTLSSEQCRDCNQCTTSGYSVCMRIRPNRANRTVDEQRIACSCTHSVPINCHSPLDETQRAANISLKPYTICYLNALQAPPRPLAVSEAKSVVFTIEPFWLEPYWRELKLDNLTFHYDFVVKNPEHCEGTVVTSDDNVHFCNNAIPLNTTGDGIEEVKYDDYDHSDNYDQYDDELPEEVEIDRDIFVGAPEVQVYYFVDVHQPRQLDIKAPSGRTAIRDMKTSVESEILRYNLKSDFEPIDNLPPPNDSHPEEVEASEEYGATDFDDGKTKEDTQNEKEEKDEKEKTNLINVNADTAAIEKKEKDKTSDDELTAPFTREPVGEPETVTYSKEVNGSNEEEESDITVNENVDETRKSTETTEVLSNDDARTSVKNENYLTPQIGRNHSEEKQDLSFIEKITKNKGILARWIFGGTIVACLLFILGVLIFRRRCCKSKRSSKSVGVNRYNSITGQSAAIPSEKERLNQ